MALTPAFTLQPGPDNTVVLKDTTDYSDVVRSDFGILIGFSHYSGTETYLPVSAPYSDDEFYAYLSSDGIYRLRLYIVPGEEYEEMVLADKIIPSETVPYTEAWYHSADRLQEKLAAATLYWFQNRTHQSLELKLYLERRIEMAQLYFYGNMYLKSQNLFNELNHG